MSDLKPKCKNCKNFMPHSEIEIAKPDPSIKITLFKVKNGKVETVSCPIFDPDPDGDKDKCAKANFANGYCAILIDRDGVSERRYCPEIEIGCGYGKGTELVYFGWDSIFASVEDIKRQIELAINHPKWIVESHGKKMRAYKRKDGDVDVEFEDGIREFTSDSPALKALGFTPYNIKNYVLSGRG
jgi:hypothetical protein